MSFLFKRTRTARSAVRSDAKLPTVLPRRPSCSVLARLYARYPTCTSPAMAKKRSTYVAQATHAKSNFPCVKLVCQSLTSSTNRWNPLNMSRLAWELRWCDLISWFHFWLSSVTSKVRVVNFATGLIGATQLMETISCSCKSWKSNMLWLKFIISSCALSVHLSFCVIIS